jgi:hypothetical protein
LYLAGRERLQSSEAWTAEHFFIATTLTVVGVIMALN